MAGTKELKGRIDSVKETKKITSAMYLIASTKLRRARADLVRTRPYFEALKAEIKRIFRTAGEVDSRYFYPPDDDGPLDGTYGFLVITADKGLAGAYNQNVLKESMRLLRQHPDARLYVVGEYGRRFFEQHGLPIERSFLYTAQNPTMERAREIAALLLDGYDRKVLTEIFVIYTDMENALVSKPQAARLLPLHRANFAAHPDERAVREQFEFLPSAESVLDSVVQSYVSGFIYSALTDSFCSEQNARMTAMNAANQNAESLLDELSLEYNRVRQAAITQEITEVCAGARAQHQKYGRGSE